MSPALITGIFKTAHKTTQAIGERQQKNAEKMSRKRRAEVESGKRKKYAGESFNCPIMWAYKRDQNGRVTLSHGIMVRRRRQRASYRRRHYQRGGILPFLIPLGLLAAKAAAAGAISGGVGYGVEKALDRRGRR